MVDRGRVLAPTVPTASHWEGPEKGTDGFGCSPAVGSRERLHSLLNLVLFCFSICLGNPVPAQHLDKSAPQPC